MCDPISGASIFSAIQAASAQTMMMVSLGLSAATTGANFIAQSQQAAAAEAQAEAQQNAAITSMNQQARDLNERELQEREATFYRVSQAQMQSQQAQATASATSESAGLSVDALLADYDRQYESYADSQMSQLGYTTEQLGRQREGVAAQANSRINQAASRPIQQPSLVGSLASFGSAALGTYTDFAVRDPLTGDYTIQ